MLLIILRLIRRLIPSCNSVCPEICPEPRLLESGRNGLVPLYSLPLCEVVLLSYLVYIKSSFNSRWSLYYRSLGFYSTLIVPGRPKKYPLPVHHLLGPLGISTFAISIKERISALRSRPWRARRRWYWITTLLAWRLVPHQQSHQRTWTNQQFPPGA